MKKVDILKIFCFSYRANPQTERSNFDVNIAVVNFPLLIGFTRIVSCLFIVNRFLIIFAKKKKRHILDSLFCRSIYVIIYGLFVTLHVFILHFRTVK